MAAARRKTSVLSPIDSSEHLYILVNGVTGDVDGNISLAAIPSLDARLELDEMSVEESGHSLKSSDLPDMVVIRPDDDESNSSLFHMKLSLRTQRRHSVHVVDWS